MDTSADDSLVTFAYDSVSRPILEDQDGFDVTRTFDGVGNLATLTYPNGREITRTYDALNRLTSVTDATGTIQSYTYDGTRLVSKALGNGVSTSLSYDDALRLTVLDHATAGEDVRFDYAYGRDNQRVSEAFHHAPTWSQKAEYDSAERLDATTRSNHAGLVETASPIAAGRATAADWDLDGANNWLTLDETRDGASSTQTRTHGPTNEIDAVTEGSDTATFTHDADGNRLTDGEFNYTWDAFGRLRTVVNASTSHLVASYSYDALDRRVTKTVAATGETTRYFYDGAVVVEERDGAEDLLRQFVHGQRIDEALVMDRNLDGDASATGAADERVYYVHDALGTVVALTNATGHVVEGYLYDAYGAMAVVGPGANGSIEWGDDDAIGTSSAFGNPYAFTGQRFDAETGLLYYRARYYDAEAGRFLSRDPVGVWGDPLNFGNPYAYVGNRPLAFTDPTGEIAPLLVALGVAALVAATVALSSEIEPETHEPVSETGFTNHPDGVAATGTFDVPKVPGKGEIRIELFIAAEQTLFGLKGDGRRFDAAENPIDSRAFFVLDFEQGEGYVQVNPSCRTTGGCNDAWPIDGYNTVKTQSNGALAFSMETSLTHSITPLAYVSPSIDVDMTLDMTSAGAPSFRGVRDLFPSMEVTHNGRMVYHAEERWPFVDLAGVLGRGLIEGPTFEGDE